MATSDFDAYLVLLDDKGNVSIWMTTAPEEMTLN